MDLLIFFFELIIPNLLVCPTFFTFFKFIYIYSFNFVFYIVLSQVSIEYLLRSDTEINFFLILEVKNIYPLVSLSNEINLIFTIHTRLIIVKEFFMPIYDDLSIQLTIFFYCIQLLIQENYHH